MSTLIKNVGILDARRAKSEQIADISRICNVGCLVVGAQTRPQLSKVSLMNVGKLLELEDDYRLHTGPLTINREMLEEAEAGLKYCVVGPINVEPDVSPELLEAKLEGLYLIGPASVPKDLYGIFMKKVREITGHVTADADKGPSTHDNVTVTNEFLQGLPDKSDLNVSGNFFMEEEDIDHDLFGRKISSLKVTRAIKCLDKHWDLLHTVLKEYNKQRIKLIKIDFHYVPGGTVIDTFSLLTIDKQTISCHGLLILGDDLTPELIKKRDVRFEAGTIYFPSTVMEEMVTRLAPGTRGLPFEPGTLEVVTCQQNLTNARLQYWHDNSTLVVMGELDIDDDVKLDTLTAKIAHVDNYGEIVASRDIASILQSKLRRDEGSFSVRGEEEDNCSDENYDIVISNLATYTF
jgi:hypothetical protein